MSNASSSPELAQQEETHESDVVCNSLNQETLNQPDPPLPKSDPKNTPPRQPDLESEDDSPDEEQNEDEDCQEIDELQEQGTPAISLGRALHLDSPITVSQVAFGNVTRTSPSKGPNTRRRASKRKKGKCKGKPNFKKQKAIEQKLQLLKAKLNPIPFIPNKIHDFTKHEELLKKLHLWDFVHIDFDRNIRVDLITQLIATYETKARVSYVNNCRITVSRADLARAFKLPKKTKTNVNACGVEIDLERESLSDDSIGFITDFVHGWVLLHEDNSWMMPKKISDWLKLIKDGHPEEVDWASMLWCMVETELKQGVVLSDCYYASHLQHLIKCQHKEFFFTVKLDGADAEEEYQEVNEGGETRSLIEQGCSMEESCTELKAVQDFEKEEGLNDVEMMDLVKCKDIDDENEGEDDEIEEQGQWLLHGKNNFGEHFMQSCSTRNVEDFERFEEKNVEDEEIEEEDEDEDRNKFNGFLNDDALEEDGFTGNLPQAVKANQMDMLLMNSTSSFSNNAGKRIIDHDHISHHANVSNKKLRINDMWDHKPSDFGMCMEQLQNVTGRARMLYEEKEQALKLSNTNQQLLLSELEKRDVVIEHLHKAKLEEIQKKDEEIYRFERELYLMGSVLEGYRKALKEIQRAFAEYKEKAQLPEEPTYKDAGPGGLMLTAVEIEKLSKKHEEEYMNCSMKVKVFEDDWSATFHEYFEKLNSFESRVRGVEDVGKELMNIYRKRKAKQTGEAAHDVFQAQSEEVVEAEESVSIAPEEKVSGVEEN